MRDAIASFTFSSDKSDTVVLLSQNLVFVLYLSFGRSSTAPGSHSSISHHKSPAAAFVRTIGIEGFFAVSLDIYPLTLFDICST
jgi:hypothetical protein